MGPTLLSYYRSLAVSSLVWSEEGDRKYVCVTVERDVEEIKNVKMNVFSKWSLWINDQPYPCYFDEWRFSRSIFSFFFRSHEADFECSCDILRHCVSFAERNRTPFFSTISPLILQALCFSSQSLCPDSGTSRLVGVESRLWEEESSRLRKIKKVYWLTDLHPSRDSFSLVHWAPLSAFALSS